MFIFIVLFLILGFAFFTQYEKSRLELLLNQRAKEKAIFFDSLFDIKGSSLKTFAYDYTFYDEIVSFVKTGDKKWAKENIDTGLETFKANAVWIYRPDLSQIYVTNNINPTGLKEVAIPKSLFKEIFEKDKLPVFFVETEHGLMEIAGATIHPAIDKERKTKPQGYFFVGRLWNAEHLEELSKLTESRVEILPYTDEVPANGYDRDSEAIIVSKILNRWDGVPMAVLHTKSYTPLFKEITRSFNISLISLLFFSIFILLTISFFIYRWIISPLNYISASLESGDTSFLGVIKKDKSEFGIISQLIERFFLQKEKLQKEITGHIETEKAMLESQARLKALFELSPEAIYLATPEGNIIDCNPAASEITGYSKEELLKMATCELLTEESVKQISKAINERSLSGVYFAEHSCKRKGGTVFPVEMIAKLIEIDKESFFIVIVRDMTEKRKMEKELLRTRQLESLGILAGGIAHDFNNILTGIMGNIALAKIHAKPGDKISKRLDIAEKATFKAKDLTQQLLTFSKGGAPVKKAASIREILTDSLTFLLSGKDVASIFNLPENLWMIDADPGQINQVVNNLVINSLQAMQEGGQIDISAENAEITKESELPLSPGRYVKVSVKDNGSGISAEHLSRIFEPYYTTKPGGSGLGLAIVYSIMKSHKGYITAESTQGKGTSFIFYLPATEDSDKIGIAPEKDVRYTRGKILVMDDEDIIREVIVALLKHLGFEVEYAREGGEAIDLYKKAMNFAKPFDAVIIDLTIPGGMGGLETTKALLEIDPNVKAIVTSGYSNDPVMANFREYGFKDAITKPFNPEALRNVLSNIILPKKI
ncbi:MAG: PAS domain S-box protein [Bacteroidetes bacterium]|nr:PAS domain S-box protein [Bacteroidota bacterium]